MLEEKITLCGDNCMECPRYNAHTDEELQAVAELWYKVGWRERVVSKRTQCGQMQPVQGISMHQDKEDVGAFFRV